MKDNMKEMDKEQNEFVPVGSKLSRTAYEDLQKLAAKKGLSFYELIQIVCDTLIRYMDDAHNLTPEMERAMAVFEHMVGWKDTFNFAAPTCKPEVQEAIYFVGSSDRKGMRAVHVERPFMGQWKQDRNVQSILERVLEVMFPERYMRLRRLAIEMDCGSILDLLDLMIDAQDIEALNADLRRDFEDARRSDYGKQPAEQPFRRKHHKSVNDMQTRITFSDEDEKNEPPVKPFGAEW